VTSVFSMSRYTYVQNYPMEDNCMEDEIEELMSPPNLPNDGADTCPYGTWFSYDECLSNNGWDEEHCDCVCLNIGCEDDDDDYDYSNICDVTCNLVCTSSWIVIGYGKCVAKCTGATLGFGVKPCAGIATVGCWLGCDTICDSFYEGMW